MNKYAEIRDRAILYTACRGILRVKQAGISELLLWLKNAISGAGSKAYSAGKYTYDAGKRLHDLGRKLHDKAKHFHDTGKKVVNTGKLLARGGAKVGKEMLAPLADDAYEIMSGVDRVYNRTTPEGRRQRLRNDFSPMLGDVIYNAAERWHNSPIRSDVYKDLEAGYNSRGSAHKTDSYPINPDDLSTIWK